MEVLFEIIEFLNNNNVPTSSKVDNVNIKEVEDFVIINLLNKNNPVESFESNDIMVRELNLNINCYSDSDVKSLTFSEDVEDLILDFENEKIISLSILSGGELPISNFDKYGYNFNVKIKYYK